MTPKRIAELRAKYANLERLMEGVNTWTKPEMVDGVREAFAAARTVPKLVDEIERLTADRAAEGAACERLRAALRQAEEKLFHCSVGHGVADHQGYPCNLAGEARLIMIEALKQHQDDNALDRAPDRGEGA